MLGAHDLRMERDYYVIALCDLAQRYFHVVLNGRGNLLPGPGIEALHRRDGRRVDINLTGEKSLRVRKARDHRYSLDFNMLKACIRQQTAQFVSIAERKDVLHN